MLKELQETVGKEQFYKNLGNIEKKCRVMEPKETCVEAGEFANEYEQARLPELGQEKMVPQELQKEPRKKLQEIQVWKCAYYGLMGHFFLRTSAEKGFRHRERTDASMQSWRQKLTKFPE